MQKALVNLIDETLGEIEELKKSDRFSASEVSIGDSKSGIEGRDKNGKLDKEEDKKEDEEESEDEEKEMDKAEGKNSEADPNAGHHQVVKKEEKEDDDEEDEDDMDKSEGKNREADPMSKMDERMCKMESMMEKMEAYMKKYEDMDKKEDKDEKKEDMKKSADEDRLESLEKSIAGIAKVLEQIADAPVPAKSVSYKNVSPLVKSEDASEPLSKSDVVNKLFELKKSGTEVNSIDITSAELANPAELVKIANKYNIK